MKFLLTKRFNKFAVAKKEIEAKNENDLKKIMERHVGWISQVHSTKVERLEK